MKKISYAEMNKTQQRIFNTIKATNENFAVIGGPGTGKTILVQSVFTDIVNKYADKEKFVVITYSKSLSSSIKGSENLNCKTLHSFIGSFVNKFFEEEIRSKYYENYKINWEDLITAVKEIMTTKNVKNLYEVIFVDEGQDLSHDAYDFFNLISSKVYVTFDEAQEIGADSSVNNVKIQNYSTNTILNKIDAQENFYDLFENHRNTAEIEAVSKLFYNNYKKNGYSLYTITNNKKNNPKPKVSFDMNKIFPEIITDCYQQNKKVGILYPNKQAYDTMKMEMENIIEKLKQKYGKKNIINFNYKYGSGEDTINTCNIDNVGIYLMSFNVCKGHEFDAVYIPYCEDITLDSDIDKNKFYVALTRAKDTLNLFFDKNSNYACDVLNVINENKELFDIELGGECNEF